MERRDDKIGGRCVLDLIKVRFLSSSIHKYLFRVFTIQKVLPSCSEYLTPPTRKVPSLTHVE